MKTKIFTLLLLLVSTMVFGGKKPLIEDREEIIKEAIREIEASMKSPEGELYLFVQEHQISGSFDFDITLFEKGKVATVFVNGREGADIKSQNLLKDFVKDLEFNFKMPKGKKYKFNYVFKFN